MKPKNVLDTYAVMMILEKEPGYEKVQELLTEAQNDQRDILMSAINVGEVYYIVRKEYGEEAANQYLDFIRATKVKIVIPTFDNILAAARIKATYPLSYADAFAISLAQKENVSVITGDPEFKKVEQIVKVEWV